MKFEISKREDKSDDTGMNSHVTTRYCSICTRIRNGKIVQRGDSHPENCS